MNRKIVYIVLAALAVLLLVSLLWWWFLQRESTSIQSTGTFGTAQNASTTNGGGSGMQGNVANTLPGQQQNATQTNIQLGSLGGAPSSALSSSTPIAVVQAQGQVGVPGVIWLSGTPGTSGAVTRTNGPGTVFNPTPINQIAQSNPSGSPPNSFGSLGTFPQPNNGALGGTSALGSIGIAAGVGVLTCALVPAFQAAAQAIGSLLGLTENAAPQAATGGAGLATIPFSVSVADVGLRAQVGAGVTSLGATITGAANQSITIDDFMGCITRNIAKIILNQITDSVVNWINSGFNGSPSFVQNPTQFFQQTADVAAGNYIQGSALSFLCSPFQLQIRIAIAQSYAQRNANACTLTRVTSNINNFMNGLFSKNGGWPAFISFTTVPTNNPYGAFLYASVGLSGATGNAVNQKQQELLQGNGFLTFQQKQGCSGLSTTPPTVNKTNQTVEQVQGPQGEQYYQTCNWVNTTPGTVIAHSLASVQGNPLTELDMAKSFDEIISALVTQLMTRVLQSGLSNVSGASGYASNFYTPNQLQAQGQSQDLLNQLQTSSNTAVQYAQIQQGSIGDVQNAQSQLNTLYNCWAGVASSSPNAGSAVSNATQASSTIASLNTTIASYNNRITLANNAIVLLQQLQSQALSAASTNDINNVTSQFNSAQSSGQIPTQTDITNAAQNRTTLQSQLSALNAQTAASLQQCNATQ